MIHGLNVRFSFLDGVRELSRLLLHFLEFVTFQNGERVKQSATNYGGIISKAWAYRQEFLNTLLENLIELLKIEQKIKMVFARVSLEVFVGALQPSLV